MLRKLKKLDLSIVLILLAFMAISTMLVYSATLHGSTLQFDARKLAIIYTLSIIAFLVTSMVDYRILTKISYYLYGTGFLLLILVLLFGQERGGAKGWFAFPLGLEFQPVELFKVILIITLAAFAARRKGEPLRLLRDIIPIGLLTGVPILLVMAQPDFGNAIILIVILLGIYWIANIRLSYVLIGVGILAGGIYLFLHFFLLYYDPLKELLRAQGLPIHWMARVLTFVDPDTATSDQRYQVVNSIRAIGSGALTGEGYLNGSSIHSNFIPVAYTDAIFVVVGEEFGFRGASILLLLFFILIYRMILIALSCRYLSGSYIIIGIVSMLVFQVFENIGMMIGIMPLTGITLPFISYGGTSLLINMLAMGLVMSIKLHDDHLLDDE